MQLKMDRKEAEGGFLSKRLLGAYEVRAALLVSPEEEEAMKRLKLWKQALKPYKKDDRDADEELNRYDFGELVQGLTIFGSLEKIQAIEAGIVAACKQLKGHLEGGNAGERIIDI